ncbi:EAL domain-containing protein [Polynucleobacter necessarius]|uniref:EAL domain-containing protein n=1 Tax=Polynucleobacter necessarius TaxID=576610 RepID=UPI0013B0588A
MQESVSQRIKIEEEIRVAPITNQFQIYYQPQVNARGELIGVEALIRWNHLEMRSFIASRFYPYSRACWAYFRD